MIVSSLAFSNIINDIESKESCMMLMLQCDSEKHTLFACRDLCWGGTSLSGLPRAARMACTDGFVATEACVKSAA
jgi:hypothetical protein